jgi:hypothetical protein
MEPRFSLFESSRTALVAALALSILAACGGGGGGTGGTGTTTPPPGGGPVSTVSTGVMAKGSTIVNGVRFEDTSANISIDDTPKTSAALQNGMVVKVVGTVNDDGINGTAQRVKALVEARGNAASVSSANNTQSLVVNGQTVFVDDQTVFSNLAGFGGISNGIQIEVHGLRDANGRIRATRIEDDAARMADNALDEIRGVVVSGGGTNNPTTFTIGGQSIDASNAVIVPAGATYQNGSVVEVYCTHPCPPGPFLASRLKVEDAQDDAFRPASGQRMEAEGLISGFTAHPGNFSVGNTPVTTTASTHFEGGLATDLANNVKVEAEGSWNGTRLVATKIEFKRSVVRLQGPVTTSSATQFAMNVAGHAVTIKVDSLTSGAVPPANATCVQVRGQRAVPATTPPIVLAGEISTSCNGNSGRPFIQAPVEVESGSNLTLLGFTVDVSTANDQPAPFENIDRSAMTLSAFLNAVTPATTNAAGVSVPGTLVKAIFNSTAPFAVRQAELED